MPYLVDTNILLRAVSAHDPQRQMCIDATGTLIGRGETLVISAQVVIELWGVLTRQTDARPAGYGFTPAEASAQLAAIQKLYPMLPEPVGLKWQELAERYAIIGAQVHDTRHVAWALSVGISHILTLNVAHFARFAASGLTAVYPSPVLSAPNGA